jgi:hypothetical protein
MVCLICIMNFAAAFLMSTAVTGKSSRQPHRYLRQIGH